MTDPNQVEVIPSLTERLPCRCGLRVRAGDSDRLRDAPCVDDQAMTVTLTEDSGSLAFGVTHRPSGLNVCPMFAPTYRGLANAIAARDALVAMDVDWSVTLPTLSVEQHRERVRILGAIERCWPAEWYEGEWMEEACENNRRLIEGGTTVEVKP